MSDIKLLDTGIAFVTFEYSDSSRRTIRTTRNKDILNNEGVIFIKNHLYDLDTKEYVFIDTDATNIKVSSSRPIEESEVEKFVRRFSY